MMKEYVNEADSILMHTYGRYPVVMDKGDGVYLYDIEGKKYLDFGAGIAVCAFGYNNKEYNDALKAQIDKLMHTSNYYYNEPTISAGKKLMKVSGMSKVFFTNSGTEAVEGAIKLARKYYYKKTGKADSEIIAMNHSFHGRSMGALSVTGQPKYQEAFKPIMGGVVYAEFNNFDSIKALVKDNTCAIIMETIQGEGGIYPADKEFLTKVKALCEEKDILLILDEIQCGMGRSGSMFAYQSYGIMPNIVTSAKALGCGVPVGAFMADEKTSAAFEPGDHGSTYGGNPFVTAAISKVLDMFESLKVLDNVNEVSKYLTQKLLELKEKHDNIIDVRGMGLIQGIELNVPVRDIVAKALDNGLVLFAAGANIIRFVPPLVITKENVDEMITILDKCL